MAVGCFRGEDGSTPASASGHATNMDTSAAALSPEELEEILAAIRNRPNPSRVTPLPTFDAPMAPPSCAPGSDAQYPSSACPSSALTSMKVQAPSRQALPAQSSSQRSDDSFPLPHNAPSSWEALDQAGGYAIDSSAAPSAAPVLGSETGVASTTAAPLSPEEFEELLTAIRSHSNPAEAIPPLTSGAPKASLFCAPGSGEQQSPSVCPSSAFIGLQIPAPSSQALVAPPSPQWYDEDFPLPLTAPPFSEVPDLYNVPVRNLSRWRK